MRENEPIEPVEHGDRNDEDDHANRYLQSAAIAGEKVA
jgi:hypothetical protein